MSLNLSITATTASASSSTTSTDWNMTRNEIIEAALKEIGVLAEGETVTGDMIVEGAKVLNRMIKSWQNEKIFLWTVEWVQKTFSASDEVTGTDGNVYTCILSHTSSSDNKPITGANYSTYWRQTGDTGGTWESSKAYYSIGDFEVDSDTIGIEFAFVRQGGIDLPVEIISKEKYMSIADKYQTGTIRAIMFDRQLTPRIYTYPQTLNTDEVLHYLRVKKLQDFDSASDNAGFPVRWLEAIVKGLAYKLAGIYRIPLAERDRLLNEAEMERMRAKRGDKEITDGDFIESAY